MKSIEIEIVWGLSVRPDKATCGHLCSEETGASSGQILCVGWQYKEQCTIQKTMEYTSMGENTFKKLF